jgi:hypothetical protein
MIRRIRDLLYDQGFTISGARNKIQELLQDERDKKRHGEVLLDGLEVVESAEPDEEFEDVAAGVATASLVNLPLESVRLELLGIRDLLLVD